MPIFTQFLDFLIPPRCLICSKVVSNSGRVCGDCFKELYFIEKPNCSLCARPFISCEEGGTNHVCLECNSHIIPWHECRAAFVYNEGFKKLILPLKYGDQQKSLGFLSHFMYRAARDILDRTDYIIPVPLHIKRLRYRQYNQSALLAWPIGKLSRRTVLPMALQRNKETVVLGHFNKQDRQVLLKNAFEIHPKYKNILINKHVVLVDDVMTTGATLTECALILLCAGVAQVDILVGAKVVAQ